MKIDGRTLHHEVLEHLRITACQRVEDGETPSEVIRSTGFCRTTIYKWLKIHRQKGKAGLAKRKATGRKPKLTYKQQYQVRRWIVGKDPRQYGFDFGLWTRKIVAELISVKFGVSLQVTAVGKLLAWLEITPQKPLRRAYERDPERISRWMKQEYPSLRSRARRYGAEIFFLDEAGMRSDAALGRTYGLKGRTPIVKTSGQRQKVNAISAISARGSFWSSVYTDRFNAARFIEFLKDFLKRRRSKVFLVVDGHPSHHAKAVARFVQSTRGRLEIHFLPPYAPDLNPDEFVWNYLRQKGVSKKPLHKNESLKERVLQDLDSIKSNKPLIRSFFKAKSVAYIND